MTSTRIYPGADRTTQWRGGNRPVMPTINKFLIHTTESTSWPSYPSFAPTLTFHPWKPRGQRWRQHYYIDQAATTLYQPPDWSFKLNRANVVQVEVICYITPARSSTSAYYSKIPEDAYKELGEFAAWLHKEWDVPLVNAPKWERYPDSYGKTSAQRMTVAQFDSFHGICGHEHAPSNSHGDPGAKGGGLDQEKIRAYALDAVGPTPAVTTTARFLQANMRRSDLVEDATYKLWANRRASALQALTSIAPDIIGVQECTPEQAADIQQGLGVNWTFAGLNHNVRVMWDSNEFTAEEGTLLELVLPSGLRNRYLTMLRLTNRATGWGVWAGSLHLASGDPDEPNAQQLRLAQIAQATEAINSHTAQFSFPRDGATANVVLMADINDPTQPGGVRAMALQAGFKPLQDRTGQAGRLPLDLIAGESINSFNGWQTPTPREGKWIDEIFSRGLTMKRAGLRRTDKDVLPNYASDHNWIDADVNMELSPLP